MSLPEPLAELIASTPARVGLCAVDLGDGREFTHRADDVFAQASAIKIPILWTLYRQADSGDLSLDETLSVDPTNGAGGCGVLQNFASSATRVALGDLAVMMTVLSDNVATNLLIDRLGFDAVNKLIDDAGGGDQTRLRRKMIDLEARAAGRENTATPELAAQMMRRLAKDGEAGDAAALATLRTLQLRKESPITAALPKEVELANKPGMLTGLRTEWFLVRHDRADRPVQYAAALMADGADDEVIQPLFKKLATAIHHCLTSS